MLFSVTKSCNFASKAFSCYKGQFLISCLINRATPNASLSTSKACWESIQINNKTYEKDKNTNITPKILSHLNRNLYMQKHHPLCLIKEKIVNYMHSNYRSKYHTPRFAVVDQLDPVVTLKDNFDTLLVPKDHPSRKQSDSYYVNSEYMLRAHTSAHQSNLMKMGLDHFLVVGDVYRRDEIDKSHYPVFHQMEGVSLIDNKMLSKMSDNIKMFESGEKTAEKQGVHTRDISMLCEADLNNCLIGLAKTLFGQNIEYRWVECYFPFTHPSWELEVMFNGEWMEVLGCGIMEQQILHEAGISDKVGWAFGLGLERLAMILYGIPDIRLFWSQDSGFHSQFKDATHESKIKFKEFGKTPQNFNDLSFWLPLDRSYDPNDFYDLVRDQGGHCVEQVSLIDEFFNKKKGLTSHCYRIVYRHMDRPLTNQEVNVIHNQIKQVVAEQLGVTVR